VGTPGHSQANKEHHGEIGGDHGIVNCAQAGDSGRPFLNQTWSIEGTLCVDLASIRLRRLSVSGRQGAQQSAVMALVPVIRGVHAQNLRGIRGTHFRLKRIKVIGEIH
jgi:hypothetical protein